MTSKLDFQRFNLIAPVVGYLSSKILSNSRPDFCVYDAYNKASRRLLINAAQFCEWCRGSMDASCPILETFQIADLGPDSARTYAHTHTHTHTHTQYGFRFDFPARPSHWHRNGWPGTQFATSAVADEFQLTASIRPARVSF